MDMVHLKNEYFENGYLSGIRAITEVRASSMLDQFEREKENCKKRNLILEEFIYKPHLLLKDFNELIFEPAIVDVVKAILGQDIVCWSTMLFYKRSGQFVGFHQDLKYWEFKNSNCLTVQLALTDSNTNNGCLTVIPGSHTQAFHHQSKTELSNNMLVYSQHVAVDEQQKEPLELKPGEFSVHHGDLVHGSEANNSNSPRVLLAMRYCSADNPSKLYTTGTWMDGVNYEGFYKEPLITKDFDKEGIKVQPNTHEVAR